jgi:hypothetical protein
MFRLEQNSKKSGDGRPLTKMSTNREVIGMCRTRTSPMMTLSQMKWINLDMLRVLMLNGVGCEVDDIDIVAIDKGDAGERGLQFHV